MPIVQCSSCRSRFKVKVGVIGRTMKCPRCKSEFQATALHSAPRKSYGSGPIVYAGIGVGAVVVALIVMSVANRSREEAAKADAAAAERAPPEKPVTKKPLAPEKEMTPQEALAAQAQKIVEALRDDDHPLLIGWVDYARMHEARRERGLEEREWSDLANEEQYAQKDEYLGLLRGDDATRDFARLSTVEKVEVGRMGSGKGRVYATIKNPLKETKQDLTLELYASSGTWRVYELERGPIYAVGTDPNAVAAQGEREPGRTPARRLNPEGEVSEVALVEGTASNVISDVERQLAILRDLLATVEASRARRSIAAIGKPAIPILLNALVPLDLSNDADTQVATRIAMTLTDLTGQSFPISPGGNEASLTGEFAFENEENRRRWFGWWSAHKATFTGPEAPDFEEPEDEG